jgi:murein DD-endopeptidase MepM/ murein hydrolase activator NlpD
MHRKLISLTDQGRTPRPPIWRETASAHLATGAGLLICAAVAVHAMESSAATANTAPPEPGQSRPEPARPAPVDMFVEPQGATAELFVTWAAGDSLDEALERAGVDDDDAAKAGALVAGALAAGIPEETEVSILLGGNVLAAERRLERLSLRPSLAFKVTIGRTATGELKLARDAVAVDARPQKFSGRAGGDLFWSLRAAGVPAEPAREFVEAVSRRVNLGQIAPGDRFELVIDHVRDASGQSRAGPLLYGALGRAGGDNLTLVRWTVAGETGLFEPGRPTHRAEGLTRPVPGAISSTFGNRVHPILRFERFHSGVDFRARWGTPVVAAADGTVSAAGWAGGHGRQVRVAHENSVATSYSHLSGLAVGPGTRVRRGDVIGFVGSTGLSTGPHLHFEVRKHGRPVNPLGFNFAPPPITAVELAALRARASQLRGV